MGIKESPPEFQEENQYCRKDIVHNGRSVLKEKRKKEERGLDFLLFLEYTDCYVPQNSITELPTKRH